MNTYLTRPLCNDLRDSIGRFCRCSSEHGHRVCVATCIACLLPTSFILQVTAFIIGAWVMPNDFTFACDDDEGQLDAKVCGVAIIVCSAELILVFFGLGVCVRSCMGPSDMRSCIFCYMCFIPTLSLLHGILSLALCMVIAKYVADNNHRDYTMSYGFTFYVFLSTGCTTVVVSLISMCGYWCGRRQEYPQEIASDDADRETTPILQQNSMH